MMNKPTIYLAGPIVGLSYDQASTWRREVRYALEPTITVLDPMRNKAQYYDPATKLYPTYPVEAIVPRDLADIRKSDLIVCRYGIESPHVGALMELGVALERGTPVVLYTVPAYIHVHPFLRAVTVFHSADRLEVIEFVREFLL